MEILTAQEKDNSWIDAKIEEYNRHHLSFTSGLLEIPINYVIKHHVIIAGIKSCFYLGEVLSIGVLFVKDNHRNKGLGRMLLMKVENEAKVKGAKLAHLYAFDQTKDFYQKTGYEIFGILDNCPKKGHTCNYLKKKL